MKKTWMSIVLLLAGSALAQNAAAGRDYEVNYVAVPKPRPGTFAAKPPRVPVLDSDVGNWQVEGSGIDVLCDELDPSCHTTLLRTRRAATAFRLLHRESALPWRSQQVAFRVQWRAGGLEGTARLFVRVEGLNGEPLSSATSAPLRGTTLFAWEKVSLQVPAEAERLVFGLEVEGSGALLLRELRFDEAVRSATR